MEIFRPKYNSIKLRGYVWVEVFHPEDIQQMEPIFKDEGENTVNANLLAKIIDHIDATNSGVTAYQLVTGTSAWFTDPHGEWPQGETYHDQRGKNGMFVDANAAVPYGGNTQGFFLSESDTSSQPNAYTAQWVAEGTWNGTNGAGSGGDTGNITHAEMGLDWQIGTSQSSSTGTGVFGTKYAEFTITTFVMQQDDKVKLTWNIEVDQ